MAIGRFSINYGSSTGFGGGFGIFDAIKGTFGLRDPAGISVARARDTDNPYKPSSAVLPALAQAAAQQAQAALSRQSVRPNQTSVPQPVSQTFAATGPGRLEPLVKKGTQTMSLDLGNLLGNLGSQYISARWGGGGQPTVFMPPAPTLPPPIMAQGPRAGIAPTPALAGPNLFELGQQGFDYMFGPDTPTAPGAPMTNGCTPPSYCVDGRTGKVTIKQKRRRRRRLATSSDIRDLSSLKSVLSPADLKMWIATHPS
jgi:hypothetical protein